MQGFTGGSHLSDSESDNVAEDVAPPPRGRTRAAARARRQRQAQTPVLDKKGKDNEKNVDVSAPFEPQYEAYPENITYGSASENAGDESELERDENQVDLLLSVRPGRSQRNRKAPERLDPVHGKAAKASSAKSTAKAPAKAPATVQVSANAPTKSNAKASGLGDMAKAIVTAKKKQEETQSQKQKREEKNRTRRDKANAKKKVDLASDTYFSDAHVEPALVCLPLSAPQSGSEASSVLVPLEIPAKLPTLAPSVALENTQCDRGRKVKESGVADLNFIVPIQVDGRRKCSLCTVPRFFNGSTSSGSVRKHLAKDHEAAYVAICVAEGFAIKIDTDEIPPTHTESQILFTEDRFRVALARFITADDQSIRVVEGREFRDLLLLLHPDLKDDDIPRRTLMTNTITDDWAYKFQRLKTSLHASLGKISTTTDIWTSQQCQRSYLAVTAHWLHRPLRSGKLELRADLIAFKHLPGTHTGEVIGIAFVSVLDRAGITSNLGVITFDGASNNHASTEYIAEILKQRDIAWDKDDNKIICLPHGLARAVESVMVQIKNAAYPVSKENNAPTGTLKRDPIGVIRGLINAIRSSQLRRDRFKRVLLRGDHRGWRNLPPGTKLGGRELLHDVVTRWGSTYLMLNRTMELRPAVVRFCGHRKEDGVVRDGKLSDIEWQVLNDVKSILKAPHGMTQIMSTEKTPMLSLSIPALEGIKRNWVGQRLAFPHLESMLDAGVDYLTDFISMMDVKKAYIIAMFINPAIRFDWIEQFWLPLRCKQAKKVIIDEMKKYFAEGPIETIQTETKLKSFWGDIFEDLGTSTGESPTVASIVEEWGRYVTAHQKPSLGVDIVEWWDLNSLEYPILFRIALDYLPIQASSVPCERAFSSSAETDTKRRNRISPDLFEELQMLKYMSKQVRLDFSGNFGPSEDEIEDITLSHQDLERVQALDTVLANEGIDAFLKASRADSYLKPNGISIGDDSSSDSEY